MRFMKTAVVMLAVCLCIASANNSVITGEINGKVELTQTARDGIQISDASCVLSNRINYFQVNDEQQIGSGGTSVANAIGKSDQNNIYLSPTGQFAAVNQNDLTKTEMKQTDNSVSEVYRV